MECSVRRTRISLAVRPKIAMLSINQTCSSTPSKNTMQPRLQRLISGSQAWCRESLKLKPKWWRPMTKRRLWCSSWIQGTQFPSSISLSSELTMQMLFSLWISRRACTKINFQRTSFRNEIIFQGRFSLSHAQLEMIKFPCQPSQCQTHHHQRQSNNYSTHKEDYGRPRQFLLPYENGNQAVLLQVSFPLSDSIHRSGINELGFEKYWESCMSVQNDTLTVVYLLVWREGGYVSRNKGSVYEHAFSGCEMGKWSD